MIIRTLVALGIAVALVGCSSSAMNPINQETHKVYGEATEAAELLRQGKPAAESKESSINYTDKVWLPVSQMEEGLTPEIEARLGREVAVNRQFTSVQEAAAYITSLTGVPVSVTIKNSGGASEPSSAGAPAPAASSMGSGASFGSPGSSSMGASASSSPIVYSGKLSGFLDLVTARYGVFWEWEQNRISFFKTKTKTFQLVALPGSASLTSEVGGDSSGGGSSGGSSSESSGGSSGSSGGSTGGGQKTSIEMSDMSVWTGIEDSLKTMLSSDGKLTVTPAMGTITVDDTPTVLARIEKYIDEQNEALARQVVINVRVLSVDLSDGDEYGINWDVVYASLKSGFGVGLSNAFTTNADSTNLTFQLLSTSPWDGSSAIINALSEQGKVTQVTSASMMTLNNQPAPIQVGRQTSYLASSTTTVGTGGAGNTVSLSPGSVTTGFSMSMLPHILDNQKLMLQYSGDISSLAGINTVTSGDSSIQTPEIDTRNFLQRVIMRSGETLVVTGFEQFNLSSAQQGVGSAQNIFFGGGTTATKGKTVLVVLIQPVLSGNR